MILFLSIAVRGFFFPHGNYTQYSRVRATYEAVCWAAGTGQCARVLVLPGALLPAGRQVTKYKWRMLGLVSPIGKNSRGSGLGEGGVCPFYIVLGDPYDEVDGSEET